MYCNTTMNVSTTLFDMIIEKSKQVECNAGVFLSALLEYGLKSEKKSLTYKRSLVQYQKADPEKKWTCVHVALNPELYDLLTDMRSVCKISVSAFFAMVVKKYLHILVEKLINNSEDCYQEIQYEIEQMYQNKEIKWIITWQTG